MTRLHAMAAMMALVFASQISFEVASIKQNKSGGSGSYVGRQAGGRLTAENATLRELILYAYPIPSFQLTGGPSWIDTDRWDITAKLESPTPAGQSGTSNEAMALRTLLADRFQLLLSSETRQLPTYALVKARADGKLGPGITASSMDCKTSPCGLRGRVGTIRSVASPLSEFAMALTDRLQRKVVDQTGLNGAWDFTLTYTPDGDPTPPPDANAPSLFTALQEQLGLKLESTRGPVEVQVITRAARPIE